MMEGFDKAWGVCCELLSKPEFKAKLAEFVDKNCDVFEADEENKLEYTSIHNQYVEIADDALSDGLIAAMGPDFDMVAFLEAVPGYLEKVAGGGEKTTEATGETVDVLLNFTSFESFKETMLLAKRNKAGGSAAEAGSGNVTLDQEMQDMVKMAEEGEWRTLKKEPWCTCEMATSPTGVETIRCVLDSPLAPDQCLDMTFGTERKEWDDNMRIEKLPNDRYKISVKYPYMPKMEYDVRFLIKRGFPDEGCITWVYRSLKKDGETLDMSAGTAVGKGIIRPKGGGSQLCVIEEMPSMMKYVPTFLLNWFITSFMLKMLQKQEARYKKAKGIA
uniref:ADP-ribosylation factor-like protein 2-binding protein n=1 Tax=Hemiselmis tepida TaxID=464990 RepID=A0A7S0VE29_9CRYP